MVMITLVVVMMALIMVMTLAANELLCVSIKQNDF